MMIRCTTFFCRLTKLLGRLSSKRKDSAALAPGRGRYHDEGVIHLPCEIKSRQQKSRRSNRSALTADAESALASSASSPRPVQEHHRGYYRPLGFVSLSSSDNGNDNGNGNKTDLLQGEGRNGNDSSNCNAMALSKEREADQAMTT